MLHIKYQDSRPCDFIKDFSCFPYIKQCKTLDPGAEPFWPQGHNRNKLGRVLLGDGTYLISRLYALLFQTRILSKFSA